MSDFLNQWGSYYDPTVADEDTTAGDIATVDSRLGCDEQDIDYDSGYEDDSDYDSGYEDDYEDSDYEDSDDYDEDESCREDDDPDDYEDDDYEDDDYEDDDYEDDDYEDEDESCREGDDADCDGPDCDEPEVGDEPEDSAPTYASYEDAYQAGYDAAVHSYENIPDLNETDDLDLDF